MSASFLAVFAGLFLLSLFCQSDASVPIAPPAMPTSSHILYKVIDLGMPAGYNEVHAVGINDKGQVLCNAGMVKYFFSPENNISTFIWSNGKFTKLNPYASQKGTQPIAENNNGQVLMQAISLSKNDPYPEYILYQHGKYKTIDNLSRQGVDAEGLSNEGDIVGDLSLNPTAKHLVSARDNLYASDSIAKPFLWKDGKLTLLKLPNYTQATAVVHESHSSPLLISGSSKGGAFIWNHGKVSKYFIHSAWNIQIKAINNKGQAVGFVDLSNGNSKPITVENHTIKELPGPYGMATAINQKAL